MSGYYGTMPGAEGVIPIKAKMPDSYLDWTMDVRDVLTNRFTGAVDPLVSLSLSIKPSGTGEIQLSRLSVDDTGFLVTWWEAGGVSGRPYLLKLQGVTEAGREPEWVFSQTCSGVFSTGFPPAPPCAGFGTPITWTFGPSLDFANPINSGYIALLAGF